MRWASAMATAPRLETAATEAVLQLRAAFSGSRPDLVIAFVSADYGADVEHLPRLLEPWLAEALLVGCGTNGLIGASGEEEDERGIALLAAGLGDATATVLHLEQATMPPLTASREAWWRLLDLGPQSAASFMLLADPATIDAEACGRGIDRAFPGAPVVGGLASGPGEPGAARLFADRTVHHSGAVLLALSGDVVIDPVVAQGCRPIGDPLFVTACDGNLLQQLDGGNPREVLAELFSGLDAGDQARFGSSLCIGLGLPGPGQTVAPGDFLIRNVLGLDPDSGALWVGSRLARTAIVQFHLRDAESASRELKQRLGEAITGRAAPAAALQFSCVGRGRGMFGISGHDAAALRRLADVPVAGMFCAGEIAPVQGATFVHGYTSVFGLIRQRSARTG